jgi:hypothetical protein
MNGSGRPVTGLMPLVIPMLMSDCTANQIATQPQDPAAFTGRATTAIPAARTRMKHLRVPAGTPRPTTKLRRRPFGI